jgi:hypothetical protein
MSVIATKEAEGSLFLGEEGQFGRYDENDVVVVSMRYSY